MQLRSLLVTLILAATAAFVVGVVVERHSGDHHPAAAEATEQHGESAAGSETAGSESGGGEQAESGEAAGGSEATGGEQAAHTESTGGADEQSAELRPLGLDVEAAPFVALAAIASLLLALGAWRRPSRTLLATIAIAMLAFAALDAREVIHQLDESRTGLALLAALVAALHLASAIVATLLARGAGKPAERTDAITI